ncbi:MAG: alpha/beta hydrolase [Chloroflexi bacterium]|nr:alpha/beta hydrolase [Chloroflexota bacterium]
MTTQVPIANSELHTLTAVNVPGQAYQLRVFLPERYYDSDTTTYPVLYLLDGDYAFAMATDVLRYLVYGGEAPELILVAIAYDSVKMSSDGGTNMRVRDLTPFPAENRPGSGGAENFRRFVQDQVFPFVELSYRAAPSDRALWGHSLGGLFGLYVLFTSPELFQRYIIVSPALRYGSRDAFDLEKEFAQTHSEFPSTEFTLSEAEGLRTGPAKLYLAVAEFEYYYPPFPKFVRILQSRQHKNLEMQTQVLTGATHFSVVAEGLARGLKAVFGKPSLFETLLRAIQAQGIEFALNLYHDLKQNEFDRYNFAESELNALGLYLLANNQVSEAIEVFKQNLVAYPNSWKARDGLGQAYRAMDQSSK